MIFGGIFCNIQCKFYYNNLHKHAPSINRIFLAFFMKFNFLVFIYFFFFGKKKKKKKNGHTGVERFLIFGGGDGVGDKIKIWGWRGGTLFAGCKLTEEPC